MRRMKSTARRQQTVAASSSSSDDGADHEEASTPTCDAASSSAVSQRRGGVPLQWGQFICKYQAQWKDNLPMSVCLGFSFFFYTYNIIYEQQINILLILFNFRFTNIEAARKITSAFKSSMEISLF